MEVTAGRRTVKEPQLGFSGGCREQERRRSREERKTKRTEEPQGAECPSRGREEGEEPDDGWPDQEEDEEPVSGMRNPLTCHASGEAWHNQVRVSGWDRGREDGRKN
ncbi:hypothetical protein NDU88_003644 [Pleurodeles waltl]|uniref:Uncharacterized protein n=1 Tax=Pleurodeles waltl TaxID=8319 RepID=A0AAV7REH6_PLEWA|nr:hypothetical protein NDU88_003644 [Pleurodeles waltl]